jgi:hypothetical protein
MKKAGDAGLFHSVADRAYCAGAAGWAGCGSAGFMVLPSVPGSAGAGCSVAGGLVLCVVVLSVPLSLQAAIPKSATADKEARMTFFMTVSFEKSRDFQRRIAAPNR